MVEAVISDYMNPHCDPEFEDSKPIFLHDTLAHDDASHYQTWSQKVQQLRRYRPDDHSLEFWTFLWPWPWPQRSSPIFSQDNPAYDDVPSNSWALNTGASINRLWQQAGRAISFCGPTQEPVLATASTGKTRRRFRKKCRWMDREDIN